jgi:hypothetical protein
VRRSVSQRSANRKTQRRDAFLEVAALVSAASRAYAVDAANSPEAAVKRTMAIAAATARGLASAIQVAAGD